VFKQLLHDIQGSLMAMFMTIVKCAVLSIFVLVVACAMYQFAATKLDEQKYPPIGQMIDINGYKLHMIDSGSSNIDSKATPTVILESGMGSTTFDWLLVYPEIAKFARIVTYDRAGYGWSDASPLPRTSANIVTELHTMLHKAGIPGPYILVGHSFGGINVRLFAATYPQDVVGIVLVDAVHKYVMDRIPQVFIHFKHWVYCRLLTAYLGISRIFSDFKLYYHRPVDTYKLMDKAHKNTIKYYHALFNQLNLITTSCEQLKAVHEFLPNVPVVVITAGKQVIPAQGPCGSYTQDEVDMINKTWFELQADLVTKSSESKQIIAEYSGHNIPYEQPEIIVDAVREMVDKLKKKSLEQFMTLFKNNWEKTELTHQVADHIIKAMIHTAFPDEAISSYEVISGGCANLNITFTLVDQEPLLLRMYLRDKDAAYKEQRIAHLLAQSIPAPEVYFIGDLGDYRYAVTEYMHGITLRDFLLEHHPSLQEIADVMYDSGKMLAGIASHTFSESGSFDHNLHIEKSSGTDEFQTFIAQCLQYPNVIKELGKETIDDIAHLVKIHAINFPSIDEKHLVHGDYDPANILVRKENGTWKISAVLDFEFAFSGSWLWDVSNMVRYAHKMPEEFETSFLQGITDSGFTLPSQWRTTVNLLNLMSLLDCLTRYSFCPLEAKPNQLQDICKLIGHIIDKLKMVD
jgi:pimeloyl-ACP methyl ester carboxylesterase/aminoglycoside phosphotransferase (APT) family kinase protein